MAACISGTILVQDDVMQDTDLHSVEKQPLNKQEAGSFQDPASFAFKL